MPSSTEKQRRFMGAELAKKRAGKRTKTGMSEGQLEDFASKSITKHIDNFISDRRITKTMAKNDISKSTGAKTRTTLKTSNTLPKPKKISMANPNTAKPNKQPVKRMNVKKGFPAAMAASAAADPKGFGEGVKSAGEGIKSAAEGISSLTPMGQKPSTKSIGMAGGGVAPVAPMKKVPSMDKGLTSDYVPMPEPMKVMIRKAFTALVPAIQKEMEKDLKKGVSDLFGGDEAAGGLVGTGIGAAVGGLPGALIGGAAGSGAGHFAGRAMDKSKVKTPKSVDIKKNPKKVAKMTKACSSKRINKAIYKSFEDFLEKGSPYSPGHLHTARGEYGCQHCAEKISPGQKYYNWRWDSSKPAVRSHLEHHEGKKYGQGFIAAQPRTPKIQGIKQPTQNLGGIEKGWKKTAGMLGGAALGSAFGPAGAALGALGGNKLGEHLEKPKATPKKASSRPRTKTISATRMMTAKNPTTRVRKASPQEGANLTSKDVKIKKVTYKDNKGNPIKKGFLTDENSVLTSTTKKIVRDGKNYHEEISDVLTRKQPEMEKSELDMAKSQASLRVSKAIFYLKGYEPMDDDSVKKMFHGQIPEIMKSAEARPPQEWMDSAVSKSAAFVADPIKYSMDLWYGIKKAVAEPINSKLSPEKKGEDKQISDGTRCDTSDLAGKDKSETTETL